MRNWDAGTIVLTTLAGLSLAACIGVQVLLFVGGIPRSALLIEGIEGQPSWVWETIPMKALGDGGSYKPAGTGAEAGGILLKLSGCADTDPENTAVHSLPSLVVLVNGNPVSDFRYGSAAVVVHRGDLLEVEIVNRGEGGPEMGEVHAKQMEVEVEEISPNVSRPRKGEKFSIDRQRTEMGNVIMI